MKVSVMPAWRGWWRWSLGITDTFNGTGASRALERYRPVRGRPTAVAREQAKGEDDVASDAAGGTHHSDPFEQAYMAGVIEQQRPRGLDTGGPAHPVAHAAPSEPFALTGCVLTPAGPVEGGYVVVGMDGLVSAVQPTKPQGVKVLDTEGVILPGLIDLHGHPEFNVFAAWEPPQLFANRYRWRDSALYKQLVRDPQNTLIAALPSGTQLRYAEVRALVSGTTAIQGASGKTRGNDEALVRNVDLRIFGQHKARSMIDLPSATSRDMVRLESIIDDVKTGAVTAFYLHLAEGMTDDERSRKEFGRLVDLKALTPATIIIHGCALTREDLGHVKDAGAKLVWSPQSNLRLYGQTTPAADAIALGIPVGLGADWLPSGSTSLLAELKVAARVLARQGAPRTHRQLVEMVTSTAAAIAGLDDHLGQVAPGRPADLLVLERIHEDPWTSVVAADPSRVELVTIGGNLTYGRADWVTELAESTDQLEPVIAWGQLMLLDSGFQANPTATRPPALSQLRADLIKNYPQVGPIFA
jgi:5-methylthioadenosine/S-adenosylhomocysteine deaminase